MRKIEQQMLQAIRNRRTWQSGNTTVNTDTVLLYGDLIGKIDDGVLSVSLAGWNTPTTRSRVNALCSLVHPRKGVFCRKGEARFRGATFGDSVGIENNEWVRVGRIA